MVTNLEAITAATKRRENRLNCQKAVLTLAMIISLSGCQSLIPPTPGDNPAYAPTYPIETTKLMAKHSNNGAIYNPQTSLSLFETPRARRVGDILTINLVEKTTAKKKALSRGLKNQTDQVLNPVAQGRPYNADTAIRYQADGTRLFTGEAESNQNNQLTGSISVTVAKVLSNGNMLVQGEKWVHINQGKEYIRLSGIVRGQDITPDNTVNSNQVANAKIAYTGTGQVANANTQGWLAKFFWSALWMI